jgi:hypothetical protein
MGFYIPGLEYRLTPYQDGSSKDKARQELLRMASNIQAVRAWVILMGTGMPTYTPKSPHCLSGKLLTLICVKLGKAGVLLHSGQTVSHRYQDDAARPEIAAMLT